jgi:predicted ester cyclase
LRLAQLPVDINFARLKPIQNMKTLRLLAAIAAAFTLFAACSEADADADKETRNVATVEALNQAWVKGDLAAMDSMISSSFVNHTPDPQWPSSGDDKKDMLAFAADMTTSFSDMSYSTAATVAQGDMVAVFGTAKGTNTGPMMGGSVPATNNPFEAYGADFYQFDEEGKIIGYWGLFDVMTMMSQLYPEMMESMMGGDHADTTAAEAPAEGY